MAPPLIGSSLLVVVVVIGLLSSSLPLPALSQVDFNLGDNSSSVVIQTPVGSVSANTTVTPPYAPGAPPKNRRAGGRPRLGSPIAPRMPGRPRRPSSTGAGGGTGRRRVAREFLSAHNAVRSYFGERPYAWNRTIALYARRWAEANLKQTCSMVHSGGPYGENLFWGTGKPWTAVEAVHNWASEHNNYNKDNNSCLPSRMCGHYTQIVWKNSVQLGCARVPCDNGGVVIMCNYDPPGNWVGESPFQ